MDMGLGGLRELVMDRGPGVLWFMGSQRAGHDWTELNKDPTNIAYPATRVEVLRNALYSRTVIIDKSL